MNKTADLIIIGAGAAGLTAAQYGARANLKTLMIEEMAPGGQALLIDRLENYPGYVEPKSGFEFAQDMHRQAEQFGAEFVNDTVTRLVKENHQFIAHLSSGDTVTAPTVILATGAKHRHLEVPGEMEFQGRGISYCGTCDGPFFKGKKMYVVGGGDAACDEAQYLSNLSDKIIMIHRRDRFRAQKTLANRVLNNKKIEIRFNTRLVEIRGDSKVRSVVLEHTDTGERYEDDTEAVFIFIGSIPQTDLVPEAEKDEAGYIVTNQRMETSIRGLFAAGDVRSSPFRQVVVAASDGAIAAHCASQYIDEIRGEAYR